MHGLPYYNITPQDGTFCLFVCFNKHEPKEFCFVKKPEIMEIVWKTAKSVVVRGIVLKASLRWKS